MSIVEKLLGEEDDNKLLHIIERFSTMSNLIASVSYGRLVSDLLTFCYSVRSQNLGDRTSRFHISGQLQYRLFAYSVNLLY